MKSLLAGLLLFAGLASGYYFVFYEKGDNPLGSSYETFLEKIKTLGELKDKTVKTAADVSSAVQTGADKFQAVKDFFEKASGVVSSTMGEIKGKLPVEALDIVSDPEKDISEKLFSFIAINNASTTPAKDLSGSICAQFAKNSKVEYSLANPFSPVADYQYLLDWGDGVLASGTVLATDTPLFVEHVYARPGIFQNTFEVKSATSTLGAGIKVCVN